MVYGFIGTGTIVEAMIDGMMASELTSAQFVVSPRNELVSSRLACRYESVTVAKSNQAVVDVCDVLVLAVRWQVAEQVLTALEIPCDMKIISVIAATDHQSLSNWTGVSATQITRAIPLPFVADRDGATAIYPADAATSELFGALGTAVCCESKKEFDLLAAASSLMGTYFGILDQVNGWMVAKGMPASKAQSYIKPLLASLANHALKSEASDFSELRKAFSTPGGLNQQVFSEFDGQGGNRILLSALDQVLAKIQS